MKQFLNIFVRNKFFLIPYSLFLFISLFILIIFEKADIHIFFNKYHNSFFDFFFKHWTHLGDGLFAVGIIFVLLFIKYKHAIITAVSTMFMALIIFLLKRTIENPRPKFFFRHFYDGDYSLYLVEGVDPGISYSFPSGHSATAFTVFFLLALFTKKSYIKLSFFMIALITAYSRVYLSWHFWGDIVAGSLIAVLISLLVYKALNKSKKVWLNLSLLKSFKRKS